jgi:polysaccharide deacetylase family protein (PEP-CTERM system associated)
MSEKHIPVHSISVDVEDYFHVAAFRNSVSPSDWDKLPSRVEQNTSKVLDLFDELGIRGTFFVLGWVAEKFPAIVRRIAGAGHELGCHSYSHQFIYELEPDSFREDTLRALDAIQQAIGNKVSLYRAPSFSITPRSTWALEILLEAGFTHDSSIFPVRHDLYGFPGAPHEPFAARIPGGKLIEFPPSTLLLFGANLPVTGGGYLRILPLFYQKRALRNVESLGNPAMLYLHPWELDPKQPHIKAPLRSRLRHYTGLSKTAERIRTLANQFDFVPMTQALPPQVPIFDLDASGKFCASPEHAPSSSFTRAVHGGTTLASR